MRKSLELCLVFSCLTLLCLETVSHSVALVSLELTEILLPLSGVTWTSTSGTVYSIRPLEASFPYFLIPYTSNKKGSTVICYMYVDCDRAISLRSSYQDPNNPMRQKQYYLLINFEEIKFLMFTQLVGKSISGFG